MFVKPYQKRILIVRKHFVNCRSNLYTSSKSEAHKRTSTICPSSTFVEWTMILKSSFPFAYGQEKVKKMYPSLKNPLLIPYERSGGHQSFPQLYHAPIHLFNHTPLPLTKDTMPYNHNIPYYQLAIVKGQKKKPYPFLFPHISSLSSSDQV